MTTGEDRRMLEITHPERCPSMEEIAIRKEIIKRLLKFGVTISLTFMIAWAILIAYVSTQYMGYTGLYIALFGTLADVIIGCIIAHQIGTKLGKYYSRRIC